MGPSHFKRRIPRIAVWDCIAEQLEKAMPLPKRYVAPVQRFVQGEYGAMLVCVDVVFFPKPKVWLVFICVTYVCIYTYIYLHILIIIYLYI